MSRPFFSFFSCPLRRNFPLLRVILLRRITSTQNVRFHSLAHRRCHHSFCSGIADLGLGSLGQERNATLALFDAVNGRLCSRHGVGDAGGVHTSVRGFRQQLSRLRSNTIEDLRVRMLVIGGWNRFRLRRHRASESGSLAGACLRRGNSGFLVTRDGQRVAAAYSISPTHAPNGSTEISLSSIFCGAAKDATKVFALLAFAPVAARFSFTFCGAPVMFSTTRTFCPL